MYYKFLIIKNKYLFVILIIILIFWPAFVFKNYIVFDYANFTSEWIKTGIVSIIFAYFINVIVKIKSKLNEYSLMIDSIDRIFINNNDLLKRKTEEIRVLIDSGQKYNKSELCFYWYRFTDDIGNIHRYICFKDTERYELLNKYLIKCHIDKYKNIMNTFLNANFNSNYYNENEYNMLMEFYETNKTFFNQLKQNIINSKI